MGTKEDLVSEMMWLSERCCAASWESELEYSLWAIVRSGVRTDYGRGTIEIVEAEGLGALAEAAGGWWSWPRGGKLTFVPMGKWLRRFANWETARRLPSTENGAQGES